MLQEIPYGDTRRRRWIRHVRPRRSVEVDPPLIHELEDQHRHERLRNAPDPHSAVGGDRAAAGLVTSRSSDDPTAGSDDGKNHAPRGIGPYESIGPGLEEIRGVGSAARAHDQEDDTWKKLQSYPLHQCSLQNRITFSRTGRPAPVEDRPAGHGRFGRTATLR